MHAETKAKVDRTREYLLKSDLPEEHKDSLGSLLDAAESSANGTPDKLQAIADTLLALSLHEIKQAVRLPARLNLAAADALKGHVEKCPLRSGNLPSWAQWVYPFRWPIALACFAPGAPDMLRQILEACK